MKIRNILALVALSCALVFVSCKKEKEGIPDHLKIIPANSAMVMTINAKVLVEKGGLDSYKDFEIYKKFHQEISRYEPKATELIDEFLKDTRSTGLDLEQIFVYFQRTGEYGDPLVIFTCGVNDSDKVSEWVDRYRDINGNDEYEIIEENGYYHCRLDYSTLLIWDKTKALLLPDVREYDEEDLPSIESLLRIDETNSIVSNVDFMKAYNAQKDYTIWVSLKEFMKRNGNEESINQLKDIAGQDWSNASVDISFNFTNEKAALSASIWPSSLMDEFQQKNPILKDSFDESLLRYFPKDFFAAIKFSFNIQEYYKAMVDQVNSMTDKFFEEEPSVDEEDDYDYYDFHNPYIPNLRSIITSEEVSKIVNSFKGDLIADIFGFQEGLVPIPYFGVAVTVNGEEAFNYLLGLLPKEITPTKTDSYYSYNIPQVMTIYAGQKDDVMYVTNSKEAIDNFYAQGYKDNLSSSSIAAFLKESHILYSINTDISSYPVIATTMLRQSMGMMEYAMFSDFIEPFSSINFIQTGNNGIELNLILKNNEKNSLKAIFEATDKSVAKAMGF